MPDGMSYSSAQGPDLAGGSLSHAELRELVGNISGMVYRGVAIPPWSLHFASEGVERLTGYPPAYFVKDGHRWAELIVPEDLERVTKTLERGAYDEGEVRVEYRIRMRDGRIRWVDGRVRLIPGNPPMYQGTVFDIDDRKRAEQALAESQAHQHYLMQSVPSSLWTADANGAIDFISQAGETYVGASRDQRRGHGWLDFLHPDDVDRVRRRWWQSLEDGSLYEASFRQRDLQGGYRWLHARALCRRDEQGRIVRWYGVTTDASDLVTTQQQLKDSEQLASATIQAVPGIVWRATATGVLDFISDACETQLGWKAHEVLGHRWMTLVHPEDAPGLTQLWANAFDTGEPMNTRYRVRDRAGCYRWYRASAIATRDADGAVARWHGLVTDIEELLQARWAAESAARTKSAFLSTMSHEIRTPLHAVLGFASLLSDTGLGPQQREFVDSIRSSGDHLLGIINAILDYSKLESGSLTLDFAECDVRALVDSAVAMVASQAALKGLELVFHADADVPRRCRLDAARITQVLVNLLSNAVKFTEAGEIEVRLAAQSTQAGTSELHFSVRDTGIGIAPSDMDRLFQDFSQLDDRNARRYGGTGLGLAISKRLIESHGGVLRVESTPEKGSLFTACVPAEACTDLDATRVSATRPLAGRRLLLVDDNRCNLEMLVRLLQSWGAEAVGFSDPQHALATFASEGSATRPTYDAALIDHAMPALDGVTVARRLGEVGSLPIVLLSSLGAVADVAHPSNIRVVHCKPIQAESLRATLAQLVAPDAVPLSPPTAPDTRASRLPDLRVLLVEDNLTNRKVAFLMLRRLGIERIEVAANGLEAVQATQRARFDLILMDVQMPELDGLEATRRIRRQRATGCPPQIIAMTGNALSEDRAACLAAGMDDHVAKPVQPALLRQALLAATARLGSRHATKQAADNLAHRDAALLATLTDPQ